MCAVCDLHNRQEGNSTSEERGPQVPFREMFSLVNVVILKKESLICCRWRTCQQQQGGKAAPPNKGVWVVVLGLLLLSGGGCLPPPPWGSAVPCWVLFSPSPCLCVVVPFFVSAKTKNKLKSNDVNITVK